MSSQGPNSGNRLTVAMIVRDAEALVAGTLNCVREIADEIIVGDTGSGDGTKAIASSLTDRLIDIPWTDDFSAARNALLQHATGDWIFWLDAGETLSAADLQRLRAHIEHQASATTLYMSLVHLPNKGGDVSGEQVGRIRLMPNNPRLQFEGRIRERLRPAMEQAGMQVGSLPITIVRDQLDHAPQVKKQKAERDIRLADLAIRDSGEQPTYLLAKAEAAMTLRDTATARKLYRLARAASISGSSEMLEAFYGELTTYDGEENGPPKQIALCVEALEIFALDAQLLCAMGSYLQAQDRVDLATRAYETCVQFGQVNPDIWHLADITEVVTICLSLCLQQQQRDEDARELLEDAIARRPEMNKVHRHLIDLHIKHGRREQAMDLANELPQETPCREAFRSAIRGACLAVEQNWIAAKAYLQTAYHGGCREAVCFRWLIVTHLALGDRRAAEKILDTWCELEPNQVEIERYRQAIDREEKIAPDTKPEPAVAARPSFAQAPAKIAATLPGGQSLRIDPPVAQPEKTSTPAPLHNPQTARAPRSFTIDTPDR